MKTLREIWRFFRRLFGEPTWVAVLCEDPPEIPRPRRVYLVGEAGQAWSAGLLCPCGCGAFIQLSLLQNDTPSWSAEVEKGGVVTLHPSIWRIRGCRSHFFIRNGKIVWAKPEPKPSCA